MVQADPEGGLQSGYCTRCGYPFASRSGQRVCHVRPACDRRLRDPTYRVPADRLAAVEVRARELLIRRAADAAADPFRAVLTYTDFCGEIDPERRYWKPPRFSGIAKLLCRIGTYEHA